MMTNELMKTGLWQQAFKVSLPVAMGYIPAGIAFGVLFVAAKLPIWAAILSSVVLYAGAAQYASIALLAGGVGISTNDWVPHLDFALVCLFAILAYEQFKAVKAYYPIFITIIAFVAAFYFISDWLLLSAICGSLALIIIHFLMGNKSTHQQAL